MKTDMKFISTGSRQVNFIRVRVPEGDLRGGSKIVLLNFDFRHYDDHLCEFTGALFQCSNLLSFINGSQDGTALKKMKSPRGFKKPEEIEIEIWEVVEEGEDFHKWQLTQKTLFDEVSWVEAAHTTDGDDLMCAGAGVFYYGRQTDSLVEDGEVVELPRPFNERYSCKTDLRAKIVSEFNGYTSTYLGT